eukprot:403353559
MQEKLREMLMVVRPTAEGNGLIPITELESILTQIGYDFLIAKLEEIIGVLDQSQSGYFYQDELIEYLLTQTPTLEYISEENLRKAISMFDYEGKGKIKYEEFEYFMQNFGESEAFYMDESRIQMLMECCKPLDSQGLVNINTLVNNISLCWKKIRQQEKIR